MSKLERLGMECLPRKICAVPLFEGGSSSAVDLVPKQWMTEVGHMHSYLMSPSGFEHKLKVADCAVSAYHLIMGNGSFCVRTGCGKHRHPLSVNRMPADRHIHPAARVTKAAIHKRVILTGYAVIFKLLRERSVRLIVFRTDKQSRGILVYTVNYARAHNAADARERAATMIEQCIHERPRLVSGGGMDHHTLGLVYNYNVVILVDHVKRDILCDRLIFGGDLFDEVKGITRPDLIFFVGQLVFLADKYYTSLIYRPRYRISRFAESGGEKGIKALALVRRLNGQTHLSSPSIPLRYQE